MGHVTSMNIGTALVVATATCCAADSATTVVDQHVHSVHVVPQSPRLEIGETLRLVVVARDSAGTVVPNVIVQWSSLAPHVATVSTAGLASAMSAGTATITASIENHTAAAHLVVTDPALPTEWRANQPPNWTTITDHDWHEMNANGWGYTHRGGSLGYVHAVDDYDYGRAAEFVYREGFPAGNDPGALHHYGISGRAGFYVAFRVKFSENWWWQDPGMKFMHVMGAGWNLYLQPMHPSPAWQEMHGQNVGRWALGTTGWGGTADGLPDYASEPFHNVNRDAAYTRAGEWQVVELQVIRSSSGQHNGAIRLWVDGTLTAEHTSVRIPAGGFENLHFAGTYGGGRFNAPYDMTFRLSNTFISVPN